MIVSSYLRWFPIYPYSSGMFHLNWRFALVGQIVNAKSREVSEPRDKVNNDHFAMKFHRHLGSAAVSLTLVTRIGRPIWYHQISWSVWVKQIWTKPQHNSKSASQFIGIYSTIFNAGWLIGPNKAIDGSCIIDKDVTIVVTLFNKLTPWVFIVDVIWIFF